MPEALGLCPSFTAGDDRVAPNALRRRINENDVARAIGYRHTHWQHLKDQVQKLLALPHRLLLVACGDVLDDDRDTDGLSLRITLRGGRDVANQRRASILSAIADQPQRRFSLHCSADHGQIVFHLLRWDTRT